MSESRKPHHPAKIIVRLDPDIRELIPQYLENRKSDVRIIREALAKQDYDIIQTLGHSMKGCGAAYGFQGITEIGKIMELAAIDKNTQVIREKVHELEYYLTHLEVIFEIEG